MIFETLRASMLLPLLQLPSTTRCMNGAIDVGPLFVLRPKPLTADAPQLMHEVLDMSGTRCTRALRSLALSIVTTIRSDWGPFQPPLLHWLPSVVMR